MLVGRPTGPGTVASPGQPGNQAGSLNLLVERHKNLSLPHALSVNLMNLTQRQLQIKSTEKRRSIALIHGGPDVKNTSCLCLDGHTISSRRVERVKPAAVIMMASQLQPSLSLNAYTVHLLAARLQFITLACRQVQPVHYRYLTVLPARYDHFMKSIFLRGNDFPLFHPFPCHNSLYHNQTSLGEKRTKPF